MADFNAKVGNGYKTDCVGNFGLETRNERGETLVQFCQEKGVIVTNIFYSLPERRLYTWEATGDNLNNIIRN